MRHFLIGLFAVAFFAAASPLAAQTSTAFSAPRLYFEGQVGAVGFADIDSRPVTGTTTVNGTSVSYSSYKSTSSFDVVATYGGEAGIRNLFGTRFRLGLGYSEFKQKLRNFSGSGTITIGGANGGTYPLGTGSTLSSDILKSAGVNDENRLKVMTANLYYDFRAVAPYRPFIGLGVGKTDISNWSKSNLTVAGALGTQVNLTRNLYAGVKLTGYWVKNPKDDLIEYKPLIFGTAMFTTGVHF